MLKLSGLSRDELSLNPSISLGASSEGKACWVDLSSLCIVDVTGDDAAVFLQGQFCNDLTRVSLTRAQITGYCTPKGRLLALPTVLGIADGFRLLLPADIKEGFLKRLSMFIMRAKVTVKERTDWICSGIIAGDDGHLDQAASLFGDSLPSSVLTVSGDETRQLIRWHSCDGAVARYLVLASTADQIAYWKACPDMAKVSENHWRLGDIEAAMPRITSETQEDFVPQMLNLQLIDGLSFTKGCYPGQEIVARMHYLGKLKRHMRRFQADFTGLDAATLPVPGDSLSSGDDAGAGMVVDAILDGSGQVQLLAVVKVSAKELSINGLTLNAPPMPYVLPSLDEADAD